MRATSDPSVVTIKMSVQEATAVRAGLTTHVAGAAQCLLDDANDLDTGGRDVEKRRDVEQKVVEQATELLTLVTLIAALGGFIDGSSDGRG